jgi:hypothetical protein
MRYELLERVDGVLQEGVFGAYADVNDAVEDAKRIAVDAGVVIEVFDHKEGRSVFRAHGADWEWLKADA